MILTVSAECLVPSHFDHDATTTSETPPSWLGPKAEAQAARSARAVQVRKASQRRKHVDPTTCERDYSRAELEFMNAIQAYKQSSGRMFPTWSEVLEVLKNLGYEKTV